MKKEFEVVSQETFKYLHVFLVNLASRTPQIHKEIELGLVLEGKLIVREGKNAWSLDQDGMYLINSMEAHEFAADDPGTLILAIQISPKLLMPFLSDAALLHFRTRFTRSGHSSSFPSSSQAKSSFFFSAAGSSSKGTRSG